MLMFFSFDTFNRERTYYVLASDMSAAMALVEAAPEHFPNVDPVTVTPVDPEDVPPYEPFTVGVGIERSLRLYTPADYFTVDFRRQNAPFKYFTLFVDGRYKVYRFLKDQGGHFVSRHKDQHTAAQFARKFQRELDEKGTRAHIAEYTELSDGTLKFVWWTDETDK